MEDFDFMDLDSLRVKFLRSTTWLPYSLWACPAIVKLFIYFVKQAVLKQWIRVRITRLLQCFFVNCTVMISLYKDLIRSALRRESGKVIRTSLELFPAHHECIFRKLNRKTKEIKIYGKCLNHPRASSDIIYISKTAEVLLEEHVISRFWLRLSKRWK